MLYNGIRLLNKKSRLDKTIIQRQILSQNRLIFQALSLDFSIGNAGLSAMLTCFNSLLISVFSPHMEQKFAFCSNSLPQLLQYIFLPAFLWNHNKTNYLHSRSLQMFLCWVFNALKIQKI